MRRRIWATVYCLDVVVSGQIGLPRMIRDQQVDTEMPRNLFDSDFDEDTTILPPSRPDTELTPILYGIAKCRVASLWKIVDSVSTDIQMCPYEEVSQIDQSIRDARLCLPPVLRWTLMAESVTDPLNIIIQRLWLEIYFLKLRVVLHKRYALPWLSREYHQESQEIAVAASMQILELQHMIHEETLPGGRFFDFSWKIACLLNQEYLLAASMLCAYIRRSQQSAPKMPGPKLPEPEIRQLLAKSLAIWERSQMSSTECKKVVEVLTAVLGTAEIEVAEREKQDTRVVSAFASQGR